jgi:chromosome partitioning protein
MIVVVGGIKGGTGKTTIATNLAALRSSLGLTLLVDADEQRSSVDWADVRSGNFDNLTTVQLAGDKVGSQVLKLAPNYDDVIIDAGGRDTNSQRSALCVADVLVIPFKPRTLDLWPLGKIKEMVGEIKTVNPNLRIIPLINMADSVGKDNTDAMDLLKEWSGVDFFVGSIGHRKSFCNAISYGLSVDELKPIDKKAVEEIKKLHDHIYSVDKMCVG